MESNPQWDFKKFEADMEKEVTYRKSLGSIASSDLKTNSTIFDQLFIFGVPPNASKQTDPTILAAFPPFKQESIPIEKIIPFSFPNYDISPGNFHEIFKFFSAKSKFINVNSKTVKMKEGIVDQFVFQINSGETKSYGICIHIIPSQLNHKYSLPFFATQATKKFTFCFCLISKMSIFNAHFTFLNYLVDISFGIISPSNNSSNEDPFSDISSIQNMISNDSFPYENLDLTGRFGHHPKIKIPDNFQAEVEKYYKKSLFSSPVTLCEDSDLYFPPPATTDNELNLWASLDILFSVLTVPDIVDLITALLLDGQVLIIGSSLQEVTMCVFGLAHILTPFNYSGLVMPILPISNDFLDLLYTPTPFLCGVPPSLKFKKMQFLESTYIVNLDKRKVSTIDFFPQYPNAKEVVTKIVELINISSNKKVLSDTNSNEGEKTSEDAEDSSMTPKRMHSQTLQPRQTMLKPIFQSKVTFSSGPRAIRPNFSNGEITAFKSPEINGNNDTQININEKSEQSNSSEELVGGRLPDVNRRMMVTDSNIEQQNEKSGDQISFPNNSFTSQKLPAVKRRPILLNPSVIQNQFKPINETNSESTEKSINSESNGENKLDHSTDKNETNDENTAIQESNSKQHQSENQTESNSIENSPKNNENTSSNENNSIESNSQKDENATNENNTQKDENASNENNTQKDEKEAKEANSQKDENATNENNTQQDEKEANSQKDENVSNDSNVQKDQMSKNENNLELPKLSPFIRMQPAFEPVNEKGTGSIIKGATDDSNSESLQFPFLHVQQHTMRRHSNLPAKISASVSLPSSEAFPSLYSIRNTNQVQLNQSATISAFPRFSLPVVNMKQMEDPNPYRLPFITKEIASKKIHLSIETINSILNALHQPFTFLKSKEDISCFFVTNAAENITIFNQELFLAANDKKDREFYSFLLESQTFQDYVERKLNEFANEKQKETGIRRRSTFGPKSLVKKNAIITTSKKYN